MKSFVLGSGWYESDWLGLFYNSRASNWIYHQHLGWLYSYSLDQHGSWFWDSTSENWFWTAPAFFPWSYYNASSVWMYFNFDSEKTRVFNHNLQA